MRLGTLQVCLENVAAPFETLQTLSPLDTGAPVRLRRARTRTAFS